MAVGAALAWFCSAIAVAGLIMEIVNLFEFRFLTPRAGEGDVVACVAMRNEARNAAACIASLLRQAEVRAVVICDDGSTDETPGVLAAIARADPRVRIVSPSAMAGATEISPKARACAAAAAAAEPIAAAFFFFTDADVRLHGGAVGSMLALAAERRVEAVSAWPRVRSRSLWDRLFAPVLMVFLLQALPLRAVRGPDARFAAGNGQLFLIERNAYVRSGGHAAVRGYVEDVALAHLLRASGSHISLANAAGVATVDGYGSLGKNVRGYGRSLYFGCGTAGSLAFAAWQIVGFVLPWLLLPRAFHAAVSGVIASVIARTLVTRRMRGAPSLQLLESPFGGLLSALCAVSACLMGCRGTFTWRGRSMRQPR
ncbi:MAG: glycosyltransferase [Candidatus Eremiobacteraeota bacterium]|nr:glycosyltransferase [Candidatus Eremiobacteraeota bacterium]MDQ2864801.1 glycosyltransferase [Candidatus Eremiobacteraeota bacterium]